MGIDIYLQPVIGLGFAIHLFHPLLELVFGPLVIRIGDLDVLDATADD